jgi:hypothetical protein
MELKSGCSKGAPSRRCAVPEKEMKMAKIAPAVLLIGSLWLALGARDAAAAEKKTVVIICSGFGTGGVTVQACSASAGLTTACPAPQIGNNCAQTLADFINVDKLKIANVASAGQTNVFYTLSR